MLKSQLQERVKELEKENSSIKESMKLIMNESTMLGDDFRGKPFLPEDIGFSVKEVVDEEKAYISREIFYKDGVSLSRLDGPGHTWVVTTPTNPTPVTVHMEDAFTAIMMLRGLGMSNLHFANLLSADGLSIELFDSLRDVGKMRDERLAKENGTKNIEG